MKIKTAFLVIIVVIVLQISLLGLPQRFTAIMQTHSERDLTVEWKEQVIDDIFSDEYTAENSWSDAYEEQVTLNPVTMPTTSQTTAHTRTMYATEKTPSQPVTVVKQGQRSREIPTREYVVTDKPPRDRTINVPDQNNNQQSGEQPDKGVGDEEELMRGGDENVGDGLEPVLEIMTETDKNTKIEPHQEEDNGSVEEVKVQKEEPDEPGELSGETADIESDTFIKSDTVSPVPKQPVNSEQSSGAESSAKTQSNDQNAATKDNSKVSISGVALEAERPEEEKSGGTERKMSAAEENSESDSSPDSEISVKPKMVLVLTESRHGSTWTMDLLSWPEATVPIFEPLLSPFLNMYSINADVRAQALAEGHDPAEFGDWKAVTLARICLCDFNGAKTKEKLGGRKYGSIHGLGYKSRRLGTEHKDEVAKSVAICDNENSLIVPKTIRLYDITELSVLPEFGCDNFKVIHLVRDPRAVLLSRMKVFHELYDGTKNLGEHITGDQDNFSEEYMRRAARDLCSHHLHNYQVGHVTTPTWLRNRYKLVRYEDLATQPDRWAANLLHFVGVRYTSEYKEYVYNTTHVKDRGVKDKGYYAVERETSELLDSWRGKLLESHWRVIEQECDDMMRTMGYKMEFEKEVR